jgi:hypothetical protein
VRRELLEQLVMLLNILKSQSDLKIRIGSSLAYEACRRCIPGTNQPSLQLLFMVAIASVGVQLSPSRSKSPRFGAQAYWCVKSLCPNFSETSQISGLMAKVFNPHSTVNSSSSYQWRNDCAWLMDVCSSAARQLDIDIVFLSD